MPKAKNPSLHKEIKQVEALYVDIIENFNRTKSALELADEHQISTAYLYNIVRKLRDQGFNLPKSKTQMTFEVERLLERLSKRYRTK